MSCNVKDRVTEHMRGKDLIEDLRTGVLVVKGAKVPFDMENDRLGAALLKEYGVVGNPFKLTALKGRDIRTGDRLPRKWGVQYNSKVLNKAQEIFEEQEGMRQVKAERSVKGLEGKVRSSMLNLLQELGIDVKVVTELKDREGKPIRGVAAADLISKTIQVLEGSEEEVEEEVVHFLVSALEKTGDPLYLSMTSLMRDRSDLRSLYNEVAAEYAPLIESGEYDDRALMNEAITRALLTREKEDRLDRWWKRAWKRFKELFNLGSDPYKEGVKRLFRENLADLHSALNSLDDPTLYRSLGRSRKEVRGEFLKTHGEVEVQAVKRELLEGKLKSLEIFEEADGTVLRYVKSDGTVVTNRVTDSNSRNFVRAMGGMERASKISSSKKAQTSRQLGEDLHNTGQLTLERLAEDRKGFKVLDLHNRKTPAMSTILKNSPLTAEMHKEMTGELNNVLDKVREIQNTIDKDEQVEVLTELRVYDPVTDTGGSIDILFLYSDGSTSVYDYKFVTPKDSIQEGRGQGKVLTVSPFMEKKVEGYDSQLSFYKRILKDVYGVYDVKTSRILPGHLALKRVKKGKKYVYTGELDTFHMGAGSSPFLRQIPVANELTGKGPIDRQLNALHTEQEELRKKRSTPQIRRRQELLRKAVQDLTLLEDFEGLLKEVSIILNAIDTRAGIRDTNSVLYMEFDQLYNAYHILSLFEGTKAAVKGSLKDLSKEKKEKIMAQLNGIGNAVDSGLTTLTEELTHRTESASGSLYDSSVIPQQLDMFDLFRSFDEVEHPVFKETDRILREARDEASLAQEALRKRWKAKDDALKEWGKSSGESLPGVYSRLWRKTDYGLKLIPMYNSEYREELQKRREEEDIEWMKEHFQIKEGARKKYEARLKRTKQRLQEEFPDSEEGSSPQYEAALKDFLETYNVWGEHKAWTSHALHTYLEVKPDKAPKFWDDRYAFINEKGNEALLDYYASWKLQMEEFSNLAEDASFRYDMIPSFRKDMIESVTSGKWDNISDWLTRDFQIQYEEDDHTAGDPPKTVPLQGMRPLVDSKGELNADLISTDLTRVMYLFGGNVYNYVETSKREARLLYLRELLIKGEEIKGVGVFKRRKSGTEVKQDTSPDTVSKYDALFNYYVYGHSFSQSDFKVLGMSGQKLGKKLTHIYSKARIGMPIRIAIATQVAGSGFMALEGMGGVHYSNKDMYESTVSFISDTKNYLGAADYFNIESEGWERHRGRRLRSTFIDRWTDDSFWYEPLGYVDRSIARRVANAMLRSHGIKDGKLIRLKDAPKGTRSLREELEMKDGEVTKELPNEIRREFRYRVKKVVKKLIGDASYEGVTVANTRLEGLLLMTFKWWMPPLLQERWGKLRNDHILDELREGRFRGTWDASGKVAEALKEERGWYKMALYTLEGLGKAALHITMLRNFRISEQAKKDRIAKGGSWTEKDEAIYKERRARLLKEFERAKQNSSDPAVREMSPERFMELRERSVARTFAEARINLFWLLLSLLMSMSGDDDKRLKDKSFASKRAADILAKIILETSFYMNPVEAMKLNQSAIPIMGLAEDAVKALQNMVQESARTAGMLEELENNPSPFMHYTLNFVPGVSQIRRMTD
jgi:hypothetical protein